MIIVICIVWFPSVLSVADYLLFIVLNKIGFVENRGNSCASNCCFHNKLILKAHKDSGFLNLQKTDLSACTYHVLGVFLSPRGAILLSGAVLQSGFHHIHRYSLQRAAEVRVSRFANRQNFCPVSFCSFRVPLGTSLWPLQR